MSLRISDFFWEDLLDEQHRWTIEQMAMFYQTTTEEVISALAKANEKYAKDPRSTLYDLPDIDSSRSTANSIPEASCGNVHGARGKDRTKNGP